MARHARHFTLEEARAELPWVEAKLAALRDARDRLTDTETRQALADGSPTNGGGHPGKKVGEAFVELQNGIAAFEQRGIVLRDLDSGLIDFPSVRDGDGDLPLLDRRRVRHRVLARARHRLLRAASRGGVGRGRRAGPGPAWQERAGEGPRDRI